MNESLARAIFSHGPAIGRHIVPSVSDKPDFADREIIGLVGDGKSRRSNEPEPFEIYLPHAQCVSLAHALVIRVNNRVPPAAVLRGVERISHDLNSDVAFYDARTLDEHLDTIIARPRLNSLILATFAFVAMPLTAICGYGVVSYSVAQRRHEIGIRLALGAAPAVISQLLLKASAPLVTISVAVGALCGWLALSQLDRLFYYSSGNSGWIIASVATLVGGIAFVASWVPARRAVHEDVLRAIGLR